MSFNNFLAGPLEKATSSTASDAWATSARFGDVQTLVLSGFERDEDYKPTRVETSRLLETARARRLPQGAVYRG